MLETYCRKLAARFQLLVPTGGKVYKSLIRKKKKNPLLFYSFSLPPSKGLRNGEGSQGLDSQHF